MKKTMISISVMLLFITSSWEKYVLDGVYTRDSLKAYLDGQSDGFLLETSSSTFIINAGYRFYQCKQVAELATRGKNFDQEIFKNALAHMDTTSFDAKEVKEFKTWGEILTTANTSFKAMNTETFLGFVMRCDEYGLSKDIFTLDEVSVCFINGIKLVSIENSSESKLSFKEIGKDMSKVNDVSIGPGYAVKVIPDTYTIGMK